jgi:ElaB/YqjD/DUF883 family membrane-anchored ribosome-binding protein
MATQNGTITKETFKTSFPDLGPLLIEEWPEIDQAALDGTGGDLDKVVTLVSQKTEHTKTLVRRQIAELSKLASEEGMEGRMKKALHRLEEKTHEISEYVRGNMLPAAESKVRDHLLVSMLTTAAFGFLLGFIFRGFGRR